MFLVKRLSAGETGDSRQVSDFGTIDHVAKLLYPRIRIGTFNGPEGRCNNRRVHPGLLLLFGYFWFRFVTFWAWSFHFLFNLSTWTVYLAWDSTSVVIYDFPQRLVWTMYQAEPTSYEDIQPNVMHYQHVMDCCAKACGNP